MGAEINPIYKREITLFFVFHDQFNLVRGQFWHQVVSALSRLQLRGSNCGPPYQVQRQSPLNQLTIGYEVQILLKSKTMYLMFDP
jgi:hypothetical protein